LDYNITNFWTEEEATALSVFKEHLRSSRDVIIVS